jgi:hypothetical protein
MPVAAETPNTRLAALIIAEDSLGSPLVLGRSLTELQIARVVATGARHVVCLVQQVSTQLLAVADNLRANGLTIDIVRSVADAADAIHPDEHVFLVASQVLISGKTLDTLLMSNPPAILCVENDAKYAQLELVDSSARWTGYALLSGATLRAVANMIGDWDAASTLLRQLVQEDARRISLSPSQIEDAMLSVRDSADAIRAGRKLLDERAFYRGGFGEWWIAQPISRLTARIAGEIGLKSRAIQYAAVGTAAAAAIIGLTGWLGISLFLLLISYLSRSTGDRLASALADLNPRGALFRSAIAAFTAVTISACSITFASRTGQWGCLILGALLVGSQLLIADRRLPVKSFARWLADPLSNITLLFLGIISTAPLAGLFFATGYSVASYLILARRQSDTVVDQE